MNHCNTANESAHSLDLSVNGDLEVQKNASFSSTDCENGQLTLLSLPGELLLSIFDYLDARQVICELGLVCKELHAIVADNLEWKVRCMKRFHGAYPIVPVDDDKFNWKRACIEREEAYHRWSKHEERMEHFSLSMAHIGGIDSVHLMHNADLCFTGSRDRTFKMWDLRRLDASDPTGSVQRAEAKDVKGHKGWVWDITSLDNILCTASWDCWLKLWDVNDDLRLVQKMKGKSAFLSVVYQHNAIIAGAYDKSIYVYDPRIEHNSFVGQLIHHKRSVLTVAADEDYIISGSEDKTIAVYDRRAGRLFKQIELDNYCMCMSYQNGQLWTGQKDGSIHVIDPTDGAFDVVQTYDVGHKNKITGIIYTMGALYSCSTDATIRVSHPHHQPELICKLTDHTADLTAIDMQNGVLASACSDVTAGIWRPKN
ncbi:F-box/WD repeat-containing protein 9-like [Diadema setosum]|uniref:F-box/WD repeat-containing protein 9-like n=1 Tax=Diadema setosum TaxID=31175 RepID=UPI003B3AFF93